MKVSVRERGATEVSGEFWKAIFLDVGFQDLADRKILWARVGRRDSWKIAAGNYVGRALFGATEIEIREKIPGAFVSMAQVLTPNAFNLANAQSPIIFDEAPHSILVRMFLAATRTYLSGAKLVEYLSTEETGAYASGRLNIPRTAALRARGIRHKVAFRRTLLSDDLPLNRTIYLALGHVIAGFGSAPLRELVARALTLRAGFAECSSPKILLSRSEATDIAIREFDHPNRRREVSEVAALAAAVLQAATLADDKPHEGSAPRSWFLNLENLFERVIRECIGSSLGGTAHVSGPLDRPPLFPDIPERFRANPDVIIRANGKKWIVDAKYKNLDDWPSTSDIYELLAHSAAFEASKAALFYPSDLNFVGTYLGSAKTGCEVWIFQVPFTNLRPTISLALKELGLPGVEATSVAA